MYKKHKIICKKYVIAIPLDVREVLSFAISQCNGGNNDPYDMKKSLNWIPPCSTKQNDMYYILLP